MLSWLLILFTLEMGLTEEMYVTNFNGENNFSYNHPYHLYFEVEPEIILFDLVHIKNNINVLTFKDNVSYGFFPSRVDYKLNINVQYNNLEVGYDHKCLHMTQANGTSPYYGDLEGGYSKFYIKYTSN